MPARWTGDLSGLPAPPESATLRLSTISTQNPGLHAVQVVSDTGWTESSLTWRSRPEPLGPPLSPWLPAAGRRIGVEVMPVAGESTLGLAVISLTRTADGLTSYATREHPDPALRPALEVMIARPEIEIWRLVYFGTDAGDPLIAGDEADPDQDGLANAIEFVLGTAPDVSSPGMGLRVSVEGGNPVFSFRRSHASVNVDVFVEASTDLGSWSRLEDGVRGVSFASSSIPGETGVERIEVSLPKGPHEVPRGFIRLRIAR